MWGAGGLGEEGCPSIPVGGLARRRGLGWQGCCRWEQHHPTHVLVAAGAALSPGRPHDEGGSPAQGTLSRCQRLSGVLTGHAATSKRPNTFPWPCGNGAQQVERLQAATWGSRWLSADITCARALLLSPHGSCSAAGAVPGHPPHRDPYLPQPPWDPAGAEGVRLGALGAAPGLLPRACGDPTPRMEQGAGRASASKARQSRPGRRELQWGVIFRKAEVLCYK